MNKKILIGSVLAAALLVAFFHIVFDAECINHAGDTVDLPAPADPDYRTAHGPPEADALEAQSRHVEDLVDTIDLPAPDDSDHRTADGLSRGDALESQSRRIDKLVDAIGLLDPADPVYWTKAGLPRVRALEDVSGLDVSAAQRDAAWAAWQFRYIEDLVDTIGLLDPADPAHWTKAGLPRVRALEDASGLDVSAAQRDAAWAAWQSRRR